MLNGKGMIIPLIAGLIKMIYYKMNSKYFRPYRGTSNNIKVELDLTNYATI